MPESIQDSRSEPRIHKGAPEDSYPLHSRLIRECRAMTLYALSMGRRVPGPLLRALEPDMGLGPDRVLRSPRNEIFAGGPGDRGGPTAGEAVFLHDSFISIQ